MPARKSAGPSVQEWVAHKPTLQQLYVKDKKTAAEVREHMISHHGFPVETKPSQYENYFSKWGWRKYISKSTWKAIGARIRSFEQAGQEFEVLMDNDPLPLSKVNQRIRLHTSWHDRFVKSCNLPPLPPNLVVRPIPSGCSSRLPFLNINLPFQRFEKHLQTCFKSTYHMHGTSDSVRTNSETSDALSSDISVEEADQALQTVVSSSKDVTIPLFTSPLHRSILCSIANNFAGLESVPKETIFDYLRSQAGDAALRTILSTGHLYTTKAIGHNLFPAAIEMDEDKLLTILLSTPQLDIQVNTKIYVEGREYIPLVWAAKLGHGASMRVLLKHSADPLVFMDQCLPESSNEGILDLYIGSYDGSDLDVDLILYLLAVVRRPNASTFAKIVEAHLYNAKLVPIVEKLDIQAWITLVDHGTVVQLFSWGAAKVLRKVLDILIEHKVDLSRRVQKKYRQGGPVVILDAVALRGDLPTLKRLRAAGAKVTTETLSFAVSSGQLDLVTYILGLGLRKGMCRRHLTPLGAALESKNENMVRLISSDNAVMLAEERLGFTSPLNQAAASGNVAWVERLLRFHGPFDAKQLGLVLAHAMAFGRREVAFTLLEAGADANTFEEGGQPPIYHALFSPDLTMIRSLLNEDADPNYYESEDIDNYAEPAIVLAAKSKDTQLVEMLVRAGVNLRPKLKNCRGPLSIAAMQNDKTMFKYLIEAGCNINENPLADLPHNVHCLAMDTGDISMLQFVLDHGTDPHDSVALFYALWGDLTSAPGLEMADLLLTRHRRWYGNQIPWASQVLWNSIYEDDFELFHKILQYGGDPGRAPECPWQCYYLDDKADDDKQDPNRFGNMSPFGCAIAWSHERNIGLRYAEYLLRNGHRHFGNCRPESIVEDSTSDGRDNPVSRSTAFLVALESGYLPVIKLLLNEGGADVNYPAEAGIKRTPIQKAAEMGKVEIIQLLLDRGADINAPAANRGGGTALQLAALKGNYPAVRLLLENGADVNAEPSYVNGRMALEAAAEHPRLDILELLLRAIASTGHDSTEQVENAIRLAERHGRHPVVEMLHAFGRDGVDGLRDPDPDMPGIDSDMDMCSPDFDAWVDLNSCGP